MSRLYYEARALGARTFGLPLLAVAIFVGVSWLAAYDVQATGGTASRAHHDAALGLLLLLEFGLPRSRVSRRPGLSLAIPPSSYISHCGAPTPRRRCSAWDC